MRNKTKQYVGATFILAGLVFLSVPLFYEWQSYKERAALENALSILSASPDEISADTAVDDSRFTKEQLEKIYEIEIPSINLKEYVLPETTNENLSIALTQINGNQQIGEGNLSIAGHRGYRGNRFFRNLPNVKPGDEIIVTTKEQTFLFEVTDSKTIEPTEVNILKDRKNSVEITLITCTINGEKRIAVKGKLLSSSKI